MKLGIIGARSKHVEYFSEAITSLSSDSRISIDYIWGDDDPSRLNEIISKGVISKRVSTPQELIKNSDAIIITLRDGTKHLFWAEAAILAGKPVFIDKPFTCAPDEASRIYSLSDMYNVAVTGGSTLCFVPEVINLTFSKQKNYQLSYKADFFSPYGGWCFYGSHLTDLCTTLFGNDYKAVSATLKKGSVTAEVIYPEFSITLCTTPEEQPLIIKADTYHIVNDQSCYYYGMKHFVDIIKKGTTLKDKRHLASVILMDGILKSIGNEAPVTF